MLTKWANLITAPARPAGAKLGLTRVRVWSQACAEQANTEEGNQAAWDWGQIQEAYLSEALKVRQANNSPCLVCGRQVRVRLGLGFLGEH